MAIKRCLGCMQEIEETVDRCPYCGFSKADHVPFHVLSPKSVLKQRYVVGKTLASDGEGNTYIAFDSKRSSTVMIREYMPSTLAERNGSAVDVLPGNEAKFQALKSDFIELHSQLLSMEQLDHTVRVLHVFEENRTAYAVMEYIEHQTLPEYLKDHGGELFWEDFEDQFHGILLNVLMIHHIGIIHRGIAPQNIWITEDGIWKLAGFSICSTRVKNSEIIPTLYNGYSAPEQYEATAIHGEWTDVYGICAVLYKIVTGTTLPAISMQSVSAEIMQPHELNSSVPMLLSRTIMGGLQISIKQREASVADLIMKLYPGSAIPNSEAYSSTTRQFSAQKKPVTTQKDQKPTKRKSKKKIPIWVYVILVSIPFIIAVTLILYGIMIGFGDGSDKENISSHGSQLSGMVDPVSSLASSEPHYSHDTSEEDELISLPNFQGNRYDTVMNEVDYAIFSFAAPVFDYSDDYDVNVIFDQSPAPNTPVEKDTLISLTISKGPQYVQVPDYSAMGPGELADYLYQYDIIGQISYEFNSEVEAGHIVTVEGYEAGDEIDRKETSSVNIIVSQGTLPGMESSDTPSTES